MKFIDLELGMPQEEDSDSDWGLFIILDEEDNMSFTHRKLLKNILRIATIYEDEDTDEFSNGIYEANEDNKQRPIYGKMNYYNNTNWKPDAAAAAAAAAAENATTTQTQEDNEVDEFSDHVQSKMRFLITYAVTTSVSIALIILTFTI